MPFLFTNSSIKSLEGNKEAGKIINMGELMVIEQLLNFECTLVPAGRVENSNVVSVLLYEESVIERISLYS
jgi:hypothetical protein